MIGETRECGSVFLNFLSRCGDLGYCCLSVHDDLPLYVAVTVTASADGPTSTIVCLPSVTT
jgi:hypothetical protein